MMSEHWRSCAVAKARAPVCLRGTLAGPFGVAANGPKLTRMPPRRPVLAKVRFDAHRRGDASQQRDTSSRYLPLERGTVLDLAANMLAPYPALLTNEASHSRCLPTASTASGRSIRRP